MTRLDALKALLAKADKAGAPTTPLVVKYAVADPAKVGVGR
jgi:hypothetical protein